MSKLLRYFVPGQTWFIAAVTQDRRPVLAGNYELLIESLRRFSRSMPFDLIAYVVLPNHFHLLLTATKTTPDKIMHKVKLSFSKRLTLNGGVGSQVVWQKRYWDHVIRDQEDFNRHFDYIHFNPVKHGYVDDPSEWKYSSFSQYLAEGVYSSDWGVVNQPDISGDFGE